jgi:hypothetical protein
VPSAGGTLASFPMGCQSAGVPFHFRVQWNRFHRVSIEPHASAREAMSRMPPADATEKLSAIDVAPRPGLVPRLLRKTLLVVPAQAVRASTGSLSRQGTSMTFRGCARLRLKDLGMGTESESELRTGLQIAGNPTGSLLHRRLDTKLRAGQQSRGDPCPGRATRQDYPLPRALALVWCV